MLRPLVRSAPRPQSSFLTRTRPLLIAFGISLPFLTPRPVTRYDTSFSTSSLFSYPSDAKTPVTKDNRTLNPAAIKQISFGSILGLGAGIVISAFSRSLTLLLGLGIVVWQYAARRGYNFVPVERMQRYVKGVNLRGMVYDNVAFKMSFGLAFALTAFGDLGGVD